MVWEVPAGHSKSAQQAAQAAAVNLQRVRPHLSFDELCFLFNPYANGFPEGLQGKL